MDDNIDIANERAALHLKAALARRKPTGPEATGACLYCEEPLADGRRWCPGQDCRDAWEREQRRSR